MTLIGVVIQVQQDLWLICRVNYFTVWTCYEQFINNPTNLKESDDIINFEDVLQIKNNW